MFTKTLDSKPTYMYGDYEVVDLAESIFDPDKAMTQIGSVYKVSKEMEMRPDLVSLSLYGSTDYTEMVLKYSMINNPFAIEKGDIVISAVVDSIYKPVKETDADSTGMFDAIKNYHKYIDKKKVPKTVGSDSIDENITKVPKEANISKTGGSGLTVKNGKIYFGDIGTVAQRTDSSIVDCATDGTSLGAFLNATIRNSQ